MTAAPASSSNLIGAFVATLDDDPDADWAIDTTLGNTEVRTGFPTPSDAPVTGTGLQEFRVLLRKDAAGGADPTYDIELWATRLGARERCPRSWMRGSYCPLRFFRALSRPTVREDHEVSEGG
jgi:hypothetical protein